MKIIVITQDAPIYIPQFLDSFFSLLDKNYQVSSIVVFSPFQKNIWEEIKYRFKFYGLVDFIKMVLFIIACKLKSLLFPLTKKCFSVSNVIKKYNLKVKMVKSPNEPEFVNFVKKNKIDLIISVASPRIFKSKIIKAPKVGCINYHTGLLPKYRGVVPLFWALLNREKQVGITVHFIDEKIDNGAIIIQEKVAVKNDSLHSLFEKTIKIGPTLLLKAVEMISKGQEKYIFNDSKKATYYRFPNISDAKLFKEKGNRFF